MHEFNYISPKFVNFDEISNAWALFYSLIPASVPSGKYEKRVLTGATFGPEMSF
jgi:hypothetical protein